MKTSQDSAARVLSRTQWMPMFGVAAATLLAGAAADAAEGSRYRDAVTSPRGVISGVSAQASAVGMDVLDKGGNAMDAAIAVVFAQGVTRPDSCGIGGYGALLYRTRSGEVSALDFYAQSAAATTAGNLAGPLYEQYVGHLSVGVPGVVTGMDAAYKRYASGKLKWAELVKPAEDLARLGVTVTWGLASSMTYETALDQHMFLYPETLRTYSLAGALYPPGSRLVQLDYANSLALIGKSPAAMYTGSIMRRIVADMRSPEPSPARIALYPGDPDRGLLTEKDFADYRPIWRTPARTTYRGYTVYTMPAPSAGGVGALEMLNILEGFNLAAFGPESPDFVHVFAEAEKLAWADSYWVSDPAFVTDYTATLTSDPYANQRRAQIDMNTAAINPLAGHPGAGRKPVTGPASGVPGHTCHVSVIDADGNAASVTWSVGGPFGSNVIAPGMAATDPAALASGDPNDLLGTGFVLNDEIYFNDVGTPDEPKGGKRPNTQAEPMIVERDGQLVMAIGAVGAGTIRSGVVQTLVHRIDFEQDEAHAIDAERVHAADFANPDGFKWLDRFPLMIENVRFPEATLVELARRGHVIACGREYNSFPVVSLAALGADGSRKAVTDSRHEWGACAQGLPCPQDPADLVGRLGPDDEENVYSGAISDATSPPPAACTPPQSP